MTKSNLRGVFSVSIPLSLLATASLSVGGVHADVKGEELLAKSKLAFKNASALTGTLSIHSVQNGTAIDSTGPLRMKKPAMGFLKLSSPVDTTYASNGKLVYAILPTNQYLKESVSGGGLKNFGLLAAQIGLFYGLDKTAFVDLSDPKLHPTYVGKEMLRGASFDVMKVSGTKPFAFKMKLYVSSANSLITRTVLDADIQGNKLEQTIEILNLKLNPALTDSSFVVTLPRGAKPYVQAKAEQDPYEAKLIAVGKTAPAFSLPDPKGGTVSLAESLRGKKAVLVTCWFYG